MIVNSYCYYNIIYKTTVLYMIFLKAQQKRSLDYFLSTTIPMLMFNKIFYLYTFCTLHKTIIKSQTSYLSISLFVAHQQENRKLWGRHEIYISAVEVYKVFVLDTEMEKIKTIDLSANKKWKEFCARNKYTEPHHCQTYDAVTDRSIV